MEVVKGITLDLLDTPESPALSSTSDVPVVETKPDAQNEGAPPAVPPAETAKPEVEAAEPAGEAEQQEESATSSTDEQSGQPTGPRGVGKRLAALTKQVDEAERRAQEASDRLQTALKTLEQLTAQRVQQQEPPVEDDPEPQAPSKADYPDPDSWDQAVLSYADRRAGWVARKEVEADRQHRAIAARQDAIADAQAAEREAFQARSEQFKAKTPDFEEVAYTPDVSVPALVAMAIVQSENGPALQYYLGKNPDVAKKLFNYPPPRQLLELGRIEQSLIAPPAPKAAISTAPRPIQPITPSAGESPPDPEHMTPDQYADYRRKQEGWADPQRPRPRPGVRH